MVDLDLFKGQVIKKIWKDNLIKGNDVFFLETEGKNTIVITASDDGKFWVDISTKQDSEKYSLEPLFKEMWKEMGLE